MTNSKHKKNVFEKYKIFFLLFSFLNIFGVFLKLHWSNCKIFPTTKSLGLQKTNSYEDYTYRLKLVYINRKKRVDVKNNRLLWYNNDLKFILNDNFQ